jgi:DNA mismatch repair protein MutS2
MVLPLRSDQRGRLPGIVHRTSDGGATLFVEPAESVSLNNQITEWKADEEHEVSRLLWELTHQIRKNTDSIVSSLNAAAVLDLISAKARYAEDEECHPAAISEDRQLHLLQARHPLLIETCRENGEAVVPIDVRLADDFDILVITGPNTGGKTVVLQTVGLLAIMHQAGMPIPAAPDSRIPIFKDIMVDIGDEQSIAQSLSTFSAHLRRIKEVIGRASPETLVLLDELGAGTDPDEGAALSQSILEELRIRAAPTVITTHLGALKGYAYQNPRVDNAAVEFDVETLRPTYHLQIGEPGASNALAIASRLGIPAELVERARGYQDHRLQELSEAIERTAERRREAEAARDDALQKARIMEARDSELQAELADLKAAQEEFSDWSRRISALRPGDEVFVKKFGKNGRVVRMSLHQQLAVVDLSEFQVEVPVGELA